MQSHNGGSGRVSERACKTVSNSVSNCSGRTLAATVGVNAAIEGSYFAYNMNKIYQDHKAEKITRDQHNKELMTQGGGSIAALTGAIIGGVIGQGVIRWPVVGEAVGSTLGSILERPIGTAIATKGIEWNRKTGCGSNLGVAGGVDDSKKDSGPTLVSHQITECFIECIKCGNNDASKFSIEKLTKKGNIVVQCLICDISLQVARFYK